MQKNTRWLRLDVCDYNGSPLCNLYDSSTDISGQAHDITVHTERNGYKEIRFSIPSTCTGETGEEKNYRLDYLISDYKLKLQSKKAYDLATQSDPPVETDWFFISESKVEHNNLSNNYDVNAKHVSQLLNTMNLDLEFTDEEGNNSGTIGEIAKTILEGTGWHLGTVAQFMEEDKFLRDGQAVEKVRSFNCAAKTGAFKMMSNLCEMFEAKPVYHGEGYYREPYNDINADVQVGRTVDILPINPFSDELEEGQIPDTVQTGDVDVLELYYDKNVKNLTRTLNTESLVTKLTAYGSYGGREEGCSLQKALHAVYTFGALTADTEYRFLFPNSQQLGAYYYFTPTDDISTDTMKWSSLDPASRSYVYDGTNLYKTYRKPTTDNPVTLTPTITYEKNYFPFIMDFSYYQKTGIFDDAMYRELAEFQTELPPLYVQAEEKSWELSLAKSDLAETATAGDGFLKFDTLDSEHGKSTIGGYLVLNLNTTTYSDGVVYRSDYDEAKRNRFAWRTATGVKDNGLAIAGKGSVVYIINHGNPTTWTKAYVRAVGKNGNFYFRDSLDNVYELGTFVEYDRKVKKTGDSNSVTEFPSSGEEGKVYFAKDDYKTYIWADNDYLEVIASDFDYSLKEFSEPTQIMLWCNDANIVSAEIFMFSSDSIAGLFGPREDSIISNKQAVEESIKDDTKNHPVIFVDQYDTAPDATLSALGYGWYYRSYLAQLYGQLYFCWGDNGDNDWGTTYVSRVEDDPENIDITSEEMSHYRYYYSMHNKMLYTRDSDNDVWKKIGDSTDEKNVLKAFAAVVKGCIRQEVLFKGVREYYYHQYTQGETTSQGNYAFINEFGNYWLFTTDQVIDPSEGGRLYLDTTERIIWQDNDSSHIIKPVEYSFDYVNKVSNNELNNTTFSRGDYNASSHVFSSSGTKYISGNIPVYENVIYQFVLPTSARIVFLRKSGKYIEDVLVSDLTLDSNLNAYTYKTPLNTAKIRIVCSDSDHGPGVNDYLQVKNCTNSIFVKDKQYIVLSSVGGGDRVGMEYLVEQFCNQANNAYLVALPALKAIQDQITNAVNEFSATIGDIYREGYWQQNDYIQGDEDKLYKDSLDNIKEISKPEATYDLTFLDLYGSKKNIGLSTSEETDDFEYPDVDISFAAHLVDSDIDVNCWAYIDSIDKCYDQPWKTTIEINTKLSPIGQQSFTDVLSRIAEVANEVKANQAIYKKANVIKGSGKLAAERLEGSIDANRVLIMGGTSNWWTDEKGNIIFEAADGSSAMMLSGNGWAIANTKDSYGDWMWRYMATGLGLTADAIYTGFLSAERIEAGSITADKLSASVGEELELGSNKSLIMYATVDGERPAGSLLTQPAGENDSAIQIAAADGDDPAFIAIKSGGQINIEGTSSINIGSDGAINIEGGSITLNSNSSLNLTALDQIKIGGEGLGIEVDYDLINNEIMQQVMDKVSRVFIQLEEPYIGQVDPFDPNQTVTHLYKGDRWIAVDPITLEPAPTEITPEEPEDDFSNVISDMDDIIDNLNNYGTIIHENSNNEEENENESEEENEEEQEEQEEENETVSIIPYYVYDGENWIKISTEEDIIEMYTRITQNSNAIILEASKTNALAEEVSSVLSVTADKIASIVGEFNSPEGSISLLQQTAKNIILGVTSVGSLLTRGSTISIMNDEINVSSDGTIYLSSGAGMYLYDYENDDVDPDNAIAMTENGMFIKTTGAFQIAANGGLYLYDIDQNSNDTNNAIIMDQNGMNIYTTGILRVHANNLMLTTDVLQSGGYSLESQLTFLSGRIDSTVSATRTRVYRMATDPSEDPEIQYYLKPGDYWVVTNDNSTWGILNEETWQEVKTKTWGDYFVEDIVYCWSGSNWILINDPTYISVMYSRIQQTESMISTEVARINDLEGVLSTQIRQTADQILLSAEQTSIEYIDTAVSGFQSQLSDLSGTVTRHETRITAMPNEIKLAAVSEAKTYTNGELDKKYTKQSDISIKDYGIIMNASTYFCIYTGQSGDSDRDYFRIKVNEGIKFKVGTTTTSITKDSYVISHPNGGAEFSKNQIQLAFKDSNGNWTSSLTLRPDTISMKTKGTVKLWGNTDSSIRFYDEGILDDNGYEKYTVNINKDRLEAPYINSARARFVSCQVDGTFKAPVLDEIRATVPTIKVSSSKPSGHHILWLKPGVTTSSSTSINQPFSLSDAAAHGWTKNGNTYTQDVAVSSFNLSGVTSVVLSGTFYRWGQDFYKSYTLSASLICANGTVLPLGTVSSNTSYNKGNYSFTKSTGISGVSQTAIAVRYTLSCADTYAFYSAVNSNSTQHSIRFTGTRTTTNQSDACEVRYIS